MPPKRVRSSETGPAGVLLSKRAAPPRFRRLQWDELVRAGDFVADLQRGFQLWEGTTGFRADAFVKPIYRRDKGRAIGAKPRRQFQA